MKIDKINWQKDHMARCSVLWPLVEHVNSSRPLDCIMGLRPILGLKRHFFVLENPFFDLAYKIMYT